jgi:hypothetical protein
MERILPSGITEEQLFHLRSLLDKFEGMQRARISFENQIRAISQGTGSTVGRLGFILEQGVVEGVEKSAIEGAGKKKILGIKCYEDAMEREMRPIVESHRLWIEWLRGVKGIGILTAAKIIAWIEPYWAELDIVLRIKKREKTGEELPEPILKTVKLFRPQARSSLIKLCGYAVNDEDKRAYFRAPNKPIVGNAKLRKMFFILFEAILRQKGKCYDLWKRYHLEEIADYPNYLQKWYSASTRQEAKKLNPKKYIPNTLALSRRRFIKTFISILWEKYQEIYGLPVTTPQHARGIPLKPKQWIHPIDLCETDRVM